ncbi:winged helix-turn-helix domain-containing protein [Mycoplasma todarodis]|uniref:HTH gntR-type domain-containing protein n=1 Tax=Mycoplasma todarodis TaxID=1937191 RepID=A0A4R0XQ20_9MOLU|nr:winged helix-turn-helix domain-containing protein [Mycoplasma todarodis]TCG11662.1 hypothetical protein C4B25_00945 [Mycoplasma todarodis]
MRIYTTKDIIKILAKEITLGKYKANEKLPSEAQLSIKFNVSRAITNKVFSILKEMDLVYSKPHQGYFVAEWFSGITHPYHLQYDVNESKLTKVKPNENFKKFLATKNLVAKNEIICKTMYSKGKKVLVSEVWLSKYLEFLNPFEEDVSLTDFINSKDILVSITRFIHFEKDDTFGNEMQIVEYKIYYGSDEVLALSRSVISHDVYSLVKKERPF